MNAELLAVSIDDLSQASRAVEQLGLTFPILYDESGDIVREYGVFNEGSGYAIPSTFIIDTEGDGPVGVHRLRLAPDVDQGHYRAARIAELIARRTVFPPIPSRRMASRNVT